MDFKVQTNPPSPVTIKYGGTLNQHSNVLHVIYWLTNPISTAYSRELWISLKPTSVLQI